jgi:hypothetical protein
MPAMVRATLLVFGLAACGGGGSVSPDASDPPLDAPDDVDAPPDANPLATLAGTGLCLDPACATFSPDVIEYRPRFELWSDTATKRRWIQLPGGAAIDTANMDRWVFPVGTRLWKEFTRDGVRVETRFITKLLEDDDAPGAWFYITYQWNEAQDDTVAVTNGVTDANGTGHDIPSREQCRECHESLRPSRVLGFAALQLDFASELLDLEDASAQGLLTAPPTTGTPNTRFPIPGTAVDRAALGYLHANCGHCHNPTSPTIDHSPMDLSLETTKLASLQDTPVYLTAVDKTAEVPFFDNGIEYTMIVISGQPDTSGLVVRMNTMNATRRMPKVGSELTDPDGQAVLRAWIDSL